MKKIITSVFILICAVTNAQIMHNFTETFDKDGFTLINVSTIPAGVYLIRVTDEQGSLYHQKFVKK